MRPIVWKEQDTYIDGFLLKETTDLLYVCSNLHGRWLHRLNGTNGRVETPCLVLLKEAVEVTFLSSPAPWEDTWVFDFHLLPSDIPFLRPISRFLETYLMREGTNVQRLEQALTEGVPFLLPNQLLVRLFQFVLSKQFDPSMRVRMQIPNELYEWFPKGEVLC